MRVLLFLLRQTALPQAAKMDVPPEPARVIATGGKALDVHPTISGIRRTHIRHDGQSSH